MNYGLPYQGSKSKIACKLVEFLPCADTFVDMFAGGCAVTHVAMLSGKYNNYVANDISDAPTLFNDAINGKYADEKRWISRDTFFAEKDENPYVRICWSFGNDQQTYMYSKEIEPWKKALHYARACNDTSLLQDMGLDIDGSRESIKAHEAEIREIYPSVGGEQLKSLQRLQSLQSLQRLQRLQRLESLQRLQRLEISQKDYRDVEIPKGSVVYCDPPYNTASSRAKHDYVTEFDFEAFYDWCSTVTVPLIISEYSLPEDRFAAVWQCRKQCNLAAAKRTTVLEKMFVPRTQLDMWRDLTTDLFFGEYER